MIEVHRCPDVATFLASAGPFLAEREAEHNLILGICSRLATDPDPPAGTYLGVALQGELVVAAAIRTPPMNLVLSETDEAGAIEAFAQELHEAGEAIPGVLGPCDHADAFGRRWSELTGAPAKLVMRERIYRAGAARPPVGVPGELRSYADGDRALVMAWIDAFVSEAFPGDIVKEPVENIVRRRVEDPDGDFLLWEVNGSAVSIAGFGGRTPGGIRIGPVYTPPERRRNGYAGALVGTMTQMLLDRGYRFCFLFTDLANPTSNGVYQRVGYEPVSDVDQYVFAGPDQRTASTRSRIAR